MRCLGFFCPPFQPYQRRSIVRPSRPTHSAALLSSDLSSSLQPSEQVSWEFLATISRYLQSCALPLTHSLLATAVQRLPACRRTGKKGIWNHLAVASAKTFISFYFIQHCFIVRVDQSRPSEPIFSSLPLPHFTSSLRLAQHRIQYRNPVFKCC